METQLSPVQQKINNLQVAIAQDYVQGQLKAALSDNAPAFAASLIDLFTVDGELQNCDPKAVIMQAMKAAILRLSINKSLGYGYILAFKGKPEFIIGYKGLIQLAIRTNQYEILNAGPVYEGELKTVNKLTGEFDLSGEKKSENVIGYFAHFEMKNGFKKTLFMTKEKVQSHAARYSKSYNSNYSPWKSEFDAMATKTVLRGLLSHWGYMSPELSNALDKEDEADKLQNEINGQANKKPMHFDNVAEAEEVPQNNFNQQPAQAAGAPF